MMSGLAAMLGNIATTVARSRWKALAGLGLIALMPQLAGAQSVCAEVKIEIKQKVSLERQAFDAVLRIRNGLDSVSITDIDTTVLFNDADGHPLSNPAGSFFVRQDSNVTTVGPATTSEIHWLIIPTAGAGGTSVLGRGYQVGAHITYKLSNDTEPHIVDVVPELITVKPQPLLKLDYFLAGDVYSDDPFTAPVEPAVPFTLGVRVRNVGAGPAHNLTIESAQPTILPDGNPQGLSVGFHIDSSFVDNAPAAPTLLLNFGDIAPQRARIGRWMMTTTLSGRFIDLTAKFTHSPELGGDLTSLIQGSIGTHILLHDVLVDLPGRDGVRDFLAHAVDGDILHVYESDSVDDAQDQAAVATDVTGTLQAGGGGYALSLPQTAGFVYTRVLDTRPDRSVVLHARRPNGSALPDANVWTSQVRNNDQSWSYYLNLFDVNATYGASPNQVYLLFSGDTPPADASITGAVFVDADNDGVHDAGETGLAAVSISLDGVTNTGASTHRTVTSDSAGTFNFNLLDAGTYAISLGEVSGYTNGAHTAGSAGGTVNATGVANITLAVSTHAAGYLLAKLPPAQPLVADLGVATISAVPAQPHVGAGVTLHFGASNAGPDNMAGKVSIGLPASANILSANTASGSFDSATRVWTTAALPASAAASLDLQVRFNTATDVSVTASIQPATAATDPQAGNNQTSLALHVGNDDHIAATLAIATQQRWLVLCTSDEISDADSYLGQLGVEHLVVDSAARFRNELRSGRWNVYWVHSTAALLDDTLTIELHEAVFRGDGLMVDGTRDDQRSVALEAWAGSELSGLLSNMFGFRLDLSDQEIILHDEVAIASSGYYSYDVLDGTVIGLYLANSGHGLPTNSPPSPTVLGNAMVQRQMGNGHVLLSGFDLLHTLSALGVEEPTSGLFQQLAALVQPVEPETYLSGDFVRLNLSAGPLDRALSLRQTLEPLSGFEVLGSTPAAQATGAGVEWNASLPASQLFLADVDLRLPNQTGDFSLESAQYDALGGTTTLGSANLTLSVRTLTKQESLLSNTLSGLAIAGSPDAQTLADIQAGMQAAMTARAQGDLSQALADLIEAATTFDNIEVTPVQDARIALDRLLRGVQQEWYEGLTVCDVDGNYGALNDDSLFTPFAANEGMAVSSLGIGSTTFKNNWTLGTSTSDFASVTAPITNNAMDWVLSLDGGEGTLTITDEATGISDEIAFAPNGGAGLRQGNAVRVLLTSTAVTSTSKTYTIDASVNSINGTLMGDSYSFSDFPLVAPLPHPVSNPIGVYQSELFRGAWQMSGTVLAAKGVPDNGMHLTVQSGEFACKLAGH